MREHRTWKGDLIPIRHQCERSMLKLAKILCPVDFSEFSARALDCAYSFARHFGSRLFVQHVTELVLALYEGLISPEIVQIAYSQKLIHIEAQMRELVGKYQGENVQGETVVQVGSAGDLILAFAEEHKIDLITMGTHGRRGFDRLVMGSTLERVLRKARCAVLAVRESVRGSLNSASPDEFFQLRRILWCTDFSENSPRALEFALSLAFAYGAEISLLHVLETAGGAEQERHVLELLDEVIPDEARTWARAVPVVRRGEPYQKIIEHAADAQTDLIVMGVRGRNIVDLAIFGSTTQRVIQLGPCPVLTVLN